MDHVTDTLARWIRFLPVRPLHYGLALALWLGQSFAIFSPQGIPLSASYDSMVKNRIVAASPDPDIVIVDIDEASLARMADEYGRWPWPRDTLAATVEYLERQGVAGVVFDILFSDPDKLNPAADASFAQSIENSQKTWLPILRLSPFNDSKSELKLANMPGFALDLGKAEPNATIAAVPPFFQSGMNNQRLGYFNVTPDKDSVIRHYHYFEEIKGWRIHSMPMSIGLSKNWLPPSNDEVLIRWMSKEHQRTSFADVFADSQRQNPQINESYWKKKWVFIGSTAPSLHDVKASPLSPLHPGIDIYATALDNLKNQNYLHMVPRFMLIFISTALIGLMLWLTFRFSHEQMSLAFVLLPLGLLLISFVSLQVGDYFVDLLSSAQIAFTFLTAVKVHGQLLVWAHSKPLTSQGLENESSEKVGIRYISVDAKKWGLAMEWPLFTIARKQKGILITDPRPLAHFFAEGQNRVWVWMIPLNLTKRDLPSELDRIDILLQNLANTAKNQILVFKETVEGKDALSLSRRRYFEKMAQLNLNLEGIDHE